ncbi:ABC transporter substrate-binding protein [Robertmurraya sp. DFI.2.37]|uniref:ABC transporter substrate-binding protein n=2 Tax=Bacillati TaxID=1783272 RepID=UPI001243CB43|nr:ABC transporter substrate-binding protein [Robertmurraya sp. DFI.2.37]MDF1508590.1 ABC transporter substrate-binding protein [Robertmurraya sp. DFI.2.37]
MKKWYSILLLLMLSIGILAGCGESETPVEENNAVEETEGSAENVNEEAFPVTITDAIGEEVVIESKPEKIVSLIPSNTEIAFALGLGNEIVGVSEHDNFPEEVYEKEIIGGMEMNVEKIISLEPNLVLAHASNAHNSTEGLQQLRDAGIKVLVVNDAATINEIYESIEMIGTATGEQEKAEEIVNDMKTKIAEIEEKAAEITETKSVIVEVNPAPDIFVVGKNTFMDEMLTLIHAENGAGDLEGWVNLDEEAVIERNPDVMITTYGYYTENAVDLLLSREGWQDVAAVKNKQVYDVHSDLVTRSGPRLAEGLEELAKAIYPEVFE